MSWEEMTFIPSTAACMSPNKFETEPEPLVL